MSFDGGYEKDSLKMMFGGKCLTCKTNFNLYVVTPRSGSDEYNSYSAAYIDSHEFSPTWSKDRHSTISYIRYQGKQRNPEVKTNIEFTCPICNSDVKLESKPSEV